MIVNALVYWELSGMLSGMKSQVHIPAGDTKRND